jgi:hypothetical protein
VAALLLAVAPAEVVVTVPILAELRALPELVPLLVQLELQLRTLHPAQILFQPAEALELLEVAESTRAALLVPLALERAVELPIRAAGDR